MDIQKALRIKRVVENYFNNNQSIGDKIPAKDLMPNFIKEGIFTSNNKDGLEIREFLRQLDEANLLKLIPNVFPERKDKNTNWFFTRLKK